jgi:hypothetical protein
VKKQYRVTITDANLKADNRQRLEQKLASYDGTKIAPNIWVCQLTEQDRAFLERVHGRKLSMQIDE